MTTRKLRPLAALALVALIGAGCGSNASSDTGTAGGSGTSADKKATSRDQAIKFSECMRRNGLSDFPDPDAKGEFQYGISVSPAVWQRTVNACKSLQPPGSLSAKRTSGQQSAALKFAQCMRDHGVKDFPDPVNGEPLIDTTHIPSSNRSGGMTILNAAVAKCRDPLDQAAAGQ